MRHHQKQILLLRQHQKQQHHNYYCNHSLRQVGLVVVLLLAVVVVLVTLAFFGDKGDGEDGRSDYNGVNLIRSISTSKMEICAIAAFFNPAKLNIRSKLLRDFRERTKAQGLYFIISELAFDQEPFQLEQPQDADLILRFRASSNLSIMWQKERLLNLALFEIDRQQLCSKIIWSDLELVFLDQDWISKTSKLLNRYPIVQPFTKILREESKDGKVIAEEPAAMHTILYNNNKNDPVFVNRTLVAVPGTPGFLWAARRDVLVQIGGFYEFCVLGGADTIMLKAFIGDETLTSQLTRRSQKFLAYKGLEAFEKHFTQYIKHVYSIVKGNVGAPKEPLIIRHLFHGSRVNRQYMERRHYLRDVEYDPNLFVFHDPNTKVLSWTSYALRTSLPKNAVKYFLDRKEEHDQQ